ncbi:MAG: DUF952 domain-containing protein [Myxococcales bacterium]|nr:DUF952 domain-containing protein [Myxococcales bacterium]
MKSETLVWNEARRYAPPSLGAEGFVHASFKDAVLESARLHFRGVPSEQLSLLAIDPRRLDVPVELAPTPRGPMPHVHGAIPEDATRVIPLASLADQPDGVTGTRVGFAAFEGMTLLDLVGPLDAVSRIASMGFEPATSCDVFGLTPRAWSSFGAELRVARQRPALDAYDVLVIPGGHATRALVRDAELLEYLASFPENRRLASVCTGALLIGAMGRLSGKPATTHASARAELAALGADVRTERVVEAGSVVTAGGVTAGIDLGLHLVRWLEGDAVAAAIAKQMEIESG